MKLIIFKRSGRLHLELHGLVDKNDAQILLRECERLLAEDHQRIDLNLSKVTRISDQVFPILEDIHDLLSRSKGTCQFIVNQPALRARLLKRKFIVNAIEKPSEPEMIKDWQTMI